MRGVILYGPPTSGKDTVTAALSAHVDRYRFIPKLKVGRGNKCGYQMTSYVELMRLRRQGRIVQENMRYGNVYAVDRMTVAAAWDDGDIPILHTGRIEDLRTIRRELPGPWTVVLLWCSRHTAERRSIDRRDPDTRDRVKVWDETRAELAHLVDGEITLRIDTDKVLPLQAARLIDGANRQIDGGTIPGRHGGRSEGGLRLIVPVVTPRTQSGGVDAAAATEYARRFARWHPTAIPLIAGSYGRGPALAPRTRRVISDLWLETLGPRHLAVAAYDPTETERLLGRGAWPLYMTRREATAGSLHRELGESLQAIWLYSHPDRFILGPAAAARLRPRGVKLAKAGPDRLAEVRASLGPECDVWHATARDPATSRACGATGVVAACFADLPDPAPTDDEEIGQLAGPIMRRLDRLGGREQRVAALERSVRARVVGG